MVVLIIKGRNNGLTLTVILEKYPIMQIYQGKGIQHSLPIIMMLI
jgi:hypothetical protein